VPVHGQCVPRPGVQLVGYQGPCLVMTGGAVRYTSSGDDALPSMPCILTMLGTLSSSRLAREWARLMISSCVVLSDSLG
jgi:hypothetical protein